ncbi:MAG: hypothetical protein AAF611_11205 [Bacteroidota bacterium]
MIKLNLFRNKYFVIALSSLFLVFSCTTHGIETANSESRTINYKVFNDYKSNTGLLKNIMTTNQYGKNSQSLKEISQTILDQVNLELGTNVIYSDEALQLPNYNGEEIIEIGKANGWINDIDVNLIDAFMINLENHDFNYAIENFENSVITLSVSDEKFDKLNMTANLIRSANHQNPEIFTQIQKSRELGGWDCALATLALAAATAGLSSCATVAACAAAVALHYNALKNFGRACFSSNKPEITNTQNN